jgi:hypothetical protein
VRQEAATIPSTRQACERLRSDHLLR